MQKQVNRAFPGETNSTIEEYNTREHAWSRDQHDKSHDVDWKEETKQQTGSDGQDATDTKKAAAA